MELMGKHCHWCWYIGGDEVEINHIDIGDIIFPYFILTTLTFIYLFNLTPSIICSRNFKRLFAIAINCKVHIFSVNIPTLKLFFILIQTKIFDVWRTIVEVSSALSIAAVYGISSA